MSSQPDFAQPHCLEGPRTEQDQRPSGHPASPRIGRHPVGDLPDLSVVAQRDVAQPLPGDRIADDETLLVSGLSQPGERREHLLGVQGRRVRREPLDQRIARTLGIPTRIVVGPCAKPNHPVVQHLIFHG